MSYEITRIPLPIAPVMGRVNCYLIASEGGFVLIDSATPRRRRDLVAAIERAGCHEGDLKLIVITHGDFDHVGNAAYLQSAHGARIGMHAADVGMATAGDMFAGRNAPSTLVRAMAKAFFGLSRRNRFTPDVMLSDGDDLSPYGLDARIVSIPGHTRGSIGVLTAEGDLFCGDLLESTRGPSLNTLIDDAAAAGASLARLRELPVQTVYPGHGTPFDLSDVPND